MSKPQNICSDIYTSGSLKGKYKRKDLYEQAMYIDTPKGIIIISGCSHSGIENIAQRAKKLFPDKSILLVCGGWHLSSKSDDEINEICKNLKLLGVEKVAPSHCTGTKQIAKIKSIFKEDFLELYLGDLINHNKLELKNFS